MSRTIVNFWLHLFVHQETISFTLDLCNRFSNRASLGRIIMREASQTENAMLSFGASLLLTMTMTMIIIIVDHGCTGRW